MEKSNAILEKHQLPFVHSMDNECCSPTEAKRISGKKLVFLSAKSLLIKREINKSLHDYYFLSLKI